VTAEQNLTTAGSLPVVTIRQGDSINLTVYLFGNGVDEGGL
jgi:hypothetical protein